MRRPIAIGTSRDEFYNQADLPALEFEALTTGNHLSCLALSFLMVAGGGAQVQDVPAATEQHGGFALPDQTGARLLLIPNLLRPEILKAALCSGGRRFPVKFERRQAERDGGNGRQTPQRFDELAGSVFAVLAGKVDLDATCFLATEPLLAGSMLLRVAAPVGSGACVERGRFATLRGRPVTHCWPIARMAPGKQAALLEFDRRGKDALASLVFVDGTRTIFADYPAEFRGRSQDLWRADDGGVLSPEGFEIVCALQRGDWYALGIAWHGAEGPSLSLWVSEGSEQFTRVVNDYWYRAPV
jgi:hypothetical protein